MQQLRTALLGLLMMAMSVAANAAQPADRAPYMTEHMPYDAFDRLPHEHLKVLNADLTVGFAPGMIDIGRDRVLRWIENSAQIVGAYYGKFPVSSARILVVPVKGAGVRTGQSFGYRGAATRVLVGSTTTDGQLKDDWVLIHEMIHFAFPQVEDEHVWIQEGLSTYIESVARVRAGARNANDVWRELVQQMPQGLPKDGDRGLDRTHTWGRTYWGGALFCLLADVEIRKRTGNRMGLQDALRAIVNAGGVTTAEWPLERALKIGDEAVGVNVLEQLHDQYKDDPGHIDLNGLWRELGIHVAGKEITFEDLAPLAEVRKAIMRQKTGDEVMR
ncbi:MAG TPA: hypothetical protein VFS24_17775 [Steroidobacteraceae bacterium]|nr:hypothetical protein [Steroidobacteraceae bacterium]